MKCRYSRQMAGLLLVAGMVLLGGCLPATEPAPLALSAAARPTEPPPSPGA